MVLKNHKFELKVKHIIILVFSLVTIIVLIVNFGYRVNIAHYDVMTTDEIDEIASESYIHQFLEHVENKNYDILYSKLSNGYILYNNLEYKDFVNKIDKELGNNSLSITNINKSTFDTNVIYSYSLKIGGNDKILNIVEEKPNVWSYSFDNLYNYKTTNYSNEYNDIFVMIDSVYQDVEYIKLTCYINNRSNIELDINSEKISSIQLVLDSGEKINMATTYIDESTSIVRPNTMSSRTFEFDIGLDYQSKIDYVIFNNFEVDGNIIDFKVDVYL